MKSIDRKILRFMQEEYIRCGYMYSGACQPCFLERRLGLTNADMGPAMERLIATGHVRVRKCQAFNYELTPRERLRLIDKHDLRNGFEDRGHAFYPNDQAHGEIPCVEREASRKRVVAAK